MFGVCIVFYIFDWFGVVCGCVDLNGGVNGLI